MKQLLAAVGIADPAAAFAGCAGVEDEFARVRRAWKTAVLAAHPDKGGDREMFEAIQAAFDTLKEMKTSGACDSFAEAAKKKTSTAAAFKVNRKRTADQKPRSWVSGLFLFSSRLRSRWSVSPPTESRRVTSHTLAIRSEARRPSRARRDGPARRTGEERKENHAPPRFWGA